jgi:hypothetical protein
MSHYFFIYENKKTKAPLAAEPRDAENQNETMILYNVTYQNCTATGKAIHINISHYSTRLKDIIQTKAKGQKAGGIPFPLKELPYAAPVLPLASINLTGGTPMQR